MPPGFAAALPAEQCAKPMLDFAAETSQVPALHAATSPSGTVATGARQTRRAAPHRRAMVRLDTSNTTATDD
jgi:hypothetical protein